MPQNNSAAEDALEITGVEGPWKASLPHPGVASETGGRGLTKADLKEPTGSCRTDAREQRSEDRATQRS